jgi:hypothetical protein
MLSPTEDQSRISFGLNGNNDWLVFESKGRSERVYGFEAAARSPATAIAQYGFPISFEGRLF